MEYTVQSLLEHEITSPVAYTQLYNDYLDCDAILAMQKNIDFGFGTAKFELNVARLRMRKEFELQERYGIALNEDKQLEWFYEFFESILNIAEEKQAAI